MQVWFNKPQIYQRLLNKKKRQICCEDDNDNEDDESDNNEDDTTTTKEELAEIFCTCGSERGKHSRSCPLNPRTSSDHSDP